MVNKTRGISRPVRSSFLIEKDNVGIYKEKDVINKNQSTEGAEFVWVSECQKGEGCEIKNQFVFV
jgi:hypothetical protein